MIGPLSGDVSPQSRPSPSPQLRPGTVVRLLVEGRRGDATLVRVGSRLLAARVDGEVRAGSSYLAQVVRSGRTIVLRIVERTPQQLDAPALARAHGLPPGEASLAVVRAFVRTGLPIHSERLARALGRVRSSDRLSLAERARLAAVLEDKGLLDSTEIWERAVEASGGRGGGDGNRREPGDPTDAKDLQGGEPEDEEAAAETGNEREAEDENEPVASASVRRAFGPGTDADDLLQFINHRCGRGDPWLLVPIEFDGEGVLSATVRVRLPHAAGEVVDREERNRFVEAVLDVRHGEDRWTFGIRPSGDAVRVTALAAPRFPSAAKRATVGDGEWARLAERLAMIGVDFHLRPMSKDSNDGFSTDETPAILRSVDSRA